MFIFFTYNFWTFQNTYNYGSLLISDIIFVAFVSFLLKKFVHFNFFFRESTLNLLILSVK